MFKTHFPWAQVDQPGNETQMANKLVCCVRNPLDVIISAVNIMYHGSHGHSFKNDLKSEFPLFWDAFINSTIRSYRATIDYYIEAAREKKIPIYFFRFEDMISEPYPMFKSMFEFLLGLEDLEGTLIDHRIK